MVTRKWLLPSKVWTSIARRQQLRTHWSSQKLTICYKITLLTRPLSLPMMVSNKRN